MQKVGDLLYKVEACLEGHRALATVLSFYHRRQIVKYAELEKKRRDRDPHYLMNFEAEKPGIPKSVGIVDEIFKRIGPKSYEFLEIGSLTFEQNPLRRLIDSDQWNGTVIEGSSYHDKSNPLIREVGGRPVMPLTLNAENIRAELAAAKVSPHLDVFCLEAKGNDYWILKAFLEVYRPRVVIAEYNASFGPRIRWVLPYDPNFRWDGSNYYGASLAAMTALMVENGYRLVGCDSSASRAFFVQNQEAGLAQFGKLRAKPSYFFVAPKYHPRWFGHPRIADLPDQGPLVERKIRPSEATCIHLKKFSPPGGRWDTKTYRELEVELSNYTRDPMSSLGSYPFYLSYKWYLSNGEAFADIERRSRLELKKDPGQIVEGRRAKISPPLESFTTRRYSLQVQAPSQPGKYHLVITLVQEGNYWFDMVQGGSVLVFPIEVFRPRAALVAPESPTL